MCRNNKLNFLSWNADGLRSKIHELMDLVVSALSIDIIAVCETKLTSNINLDLPGFVCYRQDKHSSGRGQGVALIVKKELQHIPLVIPTTKNIEAIGIQIKLSGKVVSVISVYQSPNLPLLVHDLDLLFSLGERVLLMGDFNANHQLWKSPFNNTRGKCLFRHMIENDYIIYGPDKPTQLNYRPDCRNTTPDLVLALNIQLQDDVQTLFKLSSNHLPVTFSVNGAVPRLDPTKIFKYHQANWKGYRHSLDTKLTITSSTYSSTSQIDAAVEHLHTAIIEARNTNVPTALQIPLFIKLPYRIKSLIRYKNYIRRIEAQCNNLALKKRLRYIINLTQFLIHICVRHHNDKIWVSKLKKVDNPSADIFKVTKQLKSKTESIPNLKTDNGLFTNCDLEKCNLLAKTFYNNMCLTRDWVSPTIESDVSSSMSLLSKSSMSFDKPTNPRDVRLVLQTLKTRKSFGDDNIHNILLKNLSLKSIVYLTNIFNGCFRLSYFPNRWKRAKTIAIKKPGKEGICPSSYRPISLLPGLSKVFEKIIYRRLLSSSSHLLIGEQFGFRAQHSTTQQLARVSEHIAHHLNLHESTGMFLLDIEKAFDTVWHEGLLYKLVSAKIPLYLIKIIESYLNNRKFRVHIQNTKSSWQTVPAGVPQGSILGPYLFLIYLNDIPIQVRTHLACFADDTASYTSASDLDLIISRLQLSLDRLHEYFTNWKLKLNETKTEAILFSRQRSCPQRKLQILNHKIPWSSQVRYLGVLLDRKLNWTKQIAHLRTKGIQSLGLLSPVLNRKSNLSPRTKLRIYTSLVRPRITYACPVWSSTCLTNHNFLQTIQNKALKIAYNTPFKTNLMKFHKELNYPTLREYIFKLTHRFYELSHKHKNSLISTIGRTKISDLKYIDGYGTYRLPHHHVLFPCECILKPVQPARQPAYGLAASQTRPPLSP